MKFEYTVTGKTIEDAYTKAVAEYSSIGDIVDSTVICEGKRGFLGIFGAQLAEIKVVIDDGRPERKPKQEKRPERKEAPRQAPQESKKEEKPQAEKPVQNPQPKQAKKADKPQPKKEKPQSEPERPPIKDEDIKVTVQEKSLAMGFIKDFIASIGFNCEVKGDLTPNEEGYVSRVVTVEGEGASVLIGHHGETLDAIQYLANLCLARKSDSDHKEYVKVIVDIENYRAKREQTLRALARKMGEKALRQGRSIHLDPMNPYERRIIHSEIQKMDGVSTHSVGYDETRKIVITVDKK
ncbi:MAG: Jag N-terminal domain-containing protein [Clostridia bacterium]|nr:Jag N-terminal domain-containing protein [Clostridia bacterium]